MWPRVRPGMRSRVRPGARPGGELRTWMRTRGELRPRMRSGSELRPGMRFRPLPRGTLDGALLEMRVLSALGAGARRMPDGALLEMIGVVSALGSGARRMPDGALLEMIGVVSALGAGARRMPDGALLEMIGVVFALGAQDLSVRPDMLKHRPEFSRRLGRRRGPRHRPLEVAGASGSADRRGPLA